MFDSPLDFLSLVIALVAFIFARKAMNQVTALRARLEAIEAMPAAAARLVPPPLPSGQEFAQTPTPTAPSVPPEPPPLAPDVESIVPAAAASAEANDTAGSAPAAPPPPPDRGFEETLGTRWVVWIGGVTPAPPGSLFGPPSLHARAPGPPPPPLPGRPLSPAAPPPP